VTFLDASCHVVTSCSLPCPAPPCPALPCPFLRCPFLPCPFLPCPALLFCSCWRQPSIVLTRKFQSIFGTHPPVHLSRLTNTLWAAGLSLHYAHTVVMVDKIVTRPTMLLRVQR